jgi:hypothetical protein
MIDTVAHTTEIPAWSPPLVKEQAEIAYRKAAAAGSAAQFETVRRVTIDQRMNGVWRHLQKRRRDNRRGYAYPVYDPAVSEEGSLFKDDPTEGMSDADRRRFGTRAELIQQIGFAVIYRRMVELALAQAEPEAQGFVAQFYQQEAAELRAKAKIGRRRQMN